MLALNKMSHAILEEAKSGPHHRGTPLARSAPRPAHPMSSDHALPPARCVPEEMVVFEPGIRAYLKRRFPRCTEIDDVIQESYLKVLRLPKARETRSPRGLFYAVARNLTLDLLRRRSRSPFEPCEADDIDRILDEAVDPGDSACREQELALLNEAIEALPARCREVMKLRKLHGLSHREIGLRLGMAERTVNVHLGAGLRRCAEFLRERGVPLS